MFEIHARIGKKAVIDRAVNHGAFILNSRNILTSGIILLAFGVMVLALLDEGIPDRSRLTQVAGQVRSLEKTTSKGGGLSAVRFSLSTDLRYFHYISKAGGIDSVWSALGQAGRSEVGILIDPADSPRRHWKIALSILCSKSGSEIK